MSTPAFVAGVRKNRENIILNKSFEKIRKTNAHIALLT